MAKAGWQKTVIIIGGIVAIVGQFWGMSYYLPLIGGVLALLGSLVK